MDTDFQKHLEAKKLSTKTIKQYLKHMRLLEKECSSINQKSINRFIAKHQTYVTRAFLKNLFEFFSEQGIDERSLPKIPKVKGKESRLKKEIVDEEDLRKIRKWLLNHVQYKYVLMFDLSYHCGLRREEVITIRNEDFYWDTWEKGLGLRLKVYGKGRERIVIVPPKIAERIAKYYIKNVERMDHEKGFFGVQVSIWHEVFKKAVKKTCKRNITLHDLRRKRATLWLDQKIDLDEIRRRLGHSDISTTQKYIIRDEEDRLNKWEIEN